MAGLGVDASISGTSGIAKAIQAELAKKMRKAIISAGRETLLATRSDTKDAFPQRWASRKSPTTRLANTWRGRAYPENSAAETLSPTFLVYTKAPEIIAAHAAGITIVPKHGAFLAYPTVEAARFGRRAFAPMLTPKIWVKENRVALRFVPMPFGGVLIADLQRFRRNRKRRGKPDTFVVDRPYGSQVMFVLIRRSALSKRLHIADIARRAGGIYRNSLQAEVGS